MTSSSNHGLRRILRILPIVLFAVVVLFSVYTAHHFAYNINDSDFASELLLGRFLADHNTIVSPDWLYHSELRLLSTNLVYMPLFKLFDDWRIVYFAGALIIQLLLVLSYHYLSRQIGLKRNAFLLSATLLLLPVCIYYGRFTLYQTYYAPCFMMGFLIVGLYLALIAHRNQHKTLAQGLRLFAMLALAFGSSLNGARQLAGTILPLLVTVFAVKAVSKPKAESLWELIKQQRYPLTLAAAVFLSAAGGFLLHNAVLRKIFVISSATDGHVAIPVVDSLRGVFVGFLTLFGYQEPRLLFSAEGILALASVFAAAVFLAFSLQPLFSRRELGSPSAGFLQVFFPVAMLLMTAVFVVTDRFVNYHAYYLPAFVWIFPWIGLFLNDSLVPLRQLTVRQALVYLACLVLFANGVYNNLYFIHPDGKQVTYDYLTEVEIDSMQRFKGVVDFIEDNGYEVGYSTHWQNNIITAMTNGRIPMIRIIRVYPYPMYTYEDALTYRQTRDLSVVEDKNVFLLLTRDESDVFSGSELAPYAIPIYEDEYYQLFTFDFSTEVWDYLLSQAKVMNQTSVLNQLLPEGE